MIATKQILCTAFIQLCRCDGTRRDESALHHSCNIITTEISRNEYLNQFFLFFFIRNSFSTSERVNSVHFMFTVNAEANTCSICDLRDATFIEFLLFFLCVIATNIFNLLILHFVFFFFFVAGRSK